MTDDNKSHDDFSKFIALHKHWLTADSVNHHLRQSVRAGPAAGNNLPKSLEETAQQISAFHAISVWYALLYVVIEGYCALGYQNPVIDDLIAQEEFTQTLRRFRNALFHYQSDPLSHKLLDFLMTSNSEIWVRKLNAAFKKFFEDKINEIGFDFSQLNIH